MVSKVSVIPYTEVSKKIERASINAWWLDSPTQLFILKTAEGEEKANIFLKFLIQMEEKFIMVIIA